MDKFLIKLNSPELKNKVRIVQKKKKSLNSGNISFTRRKAQNESVDHEEIVDDAQHSTHLTLSNDTSTEYVTQLQHKINADDDSSKKDENRLGESETQSNSAVQNGSIGNLLKEVCIRNAFFSFIGFLAATM